MNLGLWGARADHGGLAAQTWELYRHLRPAKTMVMDLGRSGRGVADLARFPDAMVLHGTDDHITRTDADAFLDGLDVVLIIETPYVAWFCDHARSRGVRTVLHANPELVRDDYSPPDVMWLPTTWEAHRRPEATVVPHPVARDVLPFRRRTSCTVFHHIAAPAMRDRNGTQLVLAACRHVRNPCHLIITGARSRIPARVGRVTIDAHLGTVPNYWDAYPPDADVLLLPRRYAGLSLPMQEAASLGMPVVSLDLEPQRGWLAPEVLLNCKARWDVDMVGGRFEVFDADPRELARKMDLLILEPALVERLSKQQDVWAESISWNVWQPKLQAMLDAVACA